MKKRDKGKKRGNEYAVIVNEGKKRGTERKWDKKEVEKN